MSYSSKYHVLRGTTPILEDSILALPLTTPKCAKYSQNLDAFDAFSWARGHFRPPEWHQTIAVIHWYLSDTFARFSWGHAIC